MSGSEFGTAVHKCFEQITWLPKNQVAWLQNPLTDEQKVVAAALQQPEVQALFTPRPGQEVYNEQPIEAINDKNEWISGSIDRLIISHDSAGKPIAAHIIDFKTNKLLPTKEDPNVYSVLKKTYTEQMKAYRKHLASALSIPTHSITVSLISCPTDFTCHPATVLTYNENEL